MIPFDWDANRIKVTAPTEAVGRIIDGGQEAKMQILGYIWETKSMSNGWTYQGGWRWCHKCQGLFFTRNPSQGVCPADKQSLDASQSGTYLTRLGESAPAGNSGPPFNFNFSAQQGSWRWCHKCQGIFFTGNPSQGVCPTDNQSHDASQSGHYAIVLDDGASTVGQTNWRWCQKCQGFFFAGNVSLGVCPRDHQSHDASQSGKYQLEFEPPPTQ
jgi:hypothetical protein